MPTSKYHQAAKVEFAKAIDHLEFGYSKLQMGRANAGLVEDVKVESYGVQQPLKAVASVSCPDSRTIQIQPWDRSNLSSIEVAIQMSGLNLTPINDGICVRLNIPPLTEERRKDLTKVVHKLEEEARIAVRNARQIAHDGLKKLFSDKEISEDDFHGSSKKLQDDVDSVNREIESLSKAKDKDIMTV
ncbi:ribosome recycling factor [Patescibacteria group bacterium]|nr:ribosome recycling factor [Patescibacteria group bacterium]